MHQQAKNRSFSLSGLGLLKVSGPGANKLLQGQLTCDVETISATHGSLGAHCQPQGRIISLFYLTRIQGDFYLVMPKMLLPVALTGLMKYAPLYQATLSDASHDWALTGTESAAPSDAAAIISLPDSTRKILLQTHSNVTDVLTYEAWHHHDMQAGLPLIYPATSGIFLPHDLNLPALHAVSFKKGCFTGQEIIARMHYRGKLKNHLYRARASLPLQPGDLLYANNKPSGTVIDCCQQVYNNHYALLLVSDAATVASETLLTQQGHSIDIQQSE